MMHRLPVIIRAALAAFVVALSAAPTATAHSYGPADAEASRSSSARAVPTGPTPFTGRPWKRGAIRLYDTTPPSYREGLDIAIRTWNESRLGVRFVRTKRRSAAHVVITRAPLLGFQAGYATIGSTPRAFVVLDTALVAVDPNPMNTSMGAIPETIAEVAAHELGHVLGLGHTSGCSLMVGSGSARCGLAAAPEGSWTCRLVQRRDVVALTRRYGGPGRVRANPYCARSSTLAGRVRLVSTPPASRDRPYDLRWRATTNTSEYLLARSALGGACPQTPEEGGGAAAMSRIHGALPRFYDYWSAEVPPRRGRYCFSIWSRNFRGTLTGPTRKVVEVVPPTVAPVTNLRAAVTEDYLSHNVVLSWTNPPRTTAVRIYRVPGPAASCAVPEAAYPAAVGYGGASTTTDYDASAGTWTYVATRSDDPEDRWTLQGPGWASAPTCVTVTVPERE